MSKINKSLAKIIAALSVLLILITVMSLGAGCAAPTVEGVWIQDVPEQVVVYTETDNEGREKTERDGTPVTNRKVVEDACTVTWTFEDGLLTIQRNTEYAYPETYGYTASDGILTLTFTRGDLPGDDIPDGDADEPDGGADEPDYAADEPDGIVYRYKFMQGGKIMTLVMDDDYIELHR